MAIQIVIDSASDILPEEAHEMGVIHIPLKVAFGDIEYLDGVTLTHRQFFEKLIESDTLPVTSQISPATYEEVFREAAKDGDDVIAIVLSSKLSGTYQSACIAADECGGRIFVIDSENVCIGERILIEYAVSLRDLGKTAEEITEAVEQKKHQVRLMALLDTLEYLKKGGRISSATAFAGGLLSIKPVIALEEGKVALVGKARGSKNGNNLLRQFIQDCGGIDFSMPYCLAYSGLSDSLLQKYVSDSAELWEGITDQLPICCVGSIIGTHIGPGAIAVAFFEK